MPEPPPIALAAGQPGATARIRQELAAGGFLRRLAPEQKPSVQTHPAANSF
jgi:hypothetical protein